MVFGHSIKNLRKKFPKAALELDLVSGRVDPENGEKRKKFSSDKMQDKMEKCVLEVLDVISKQRHSGFSHGYLLSLLIPLLEDKPITPLTGNDWEWTNICDSVQNKRCNSVFRKIDGSAYFIEGYAFSDDGGETYYTGGDSVKVIKFPCSNEQLKTQYIIKE